MPKNTPDEKEKLEKLNALRRMVESRQLTEEISEKKAQEMLAMLDSSEAMIREMPNERRVDANLNMNELNKKGRLVIKEPTDMIPTPTGTSDFDKLNQGKSLHIKGNVSNAPNFASGDQLSKFRGDLSKSVNAKRLAGKGGPLLGLLAAIPTLFSEGASAAINEQLPEDVGYNAPGSDADIIENPQSDKEMRMRILEKMGKL
jgi:hypothetical protein